MSEELFHAIFNAEGQEIYYCVKGEALYPNISKLYSALMEIEFKCGVD